MWDSVNPLHQTLALSIAGSDSGAGAGIQADLKTFSAFGVYGCTAITAITAQNTQGVQGIWPLSPEQVGAQITSVLSDMPIKAMKTGMLYHENIVESVLASLQAFEHLPLVVDPVLLATSGDSLVKDGQSGESFLRSELWWRLLKRAQLVTPNLFEAAQLMNTDVAESLDQMRDQANGLIELGLQAVLVKGGHLADGDCCDLLLYRQGAKIEEQLFQSPRIQSLNTHGTGCTLSAAITAGLAKQNKLVTAVAAAKRYIVKAIEQAKQQTLGQGAGPLQHFIHD